MSFEKACNSELVRQMERAMGIEPTSKAWEALILPLNYARSEETVAQDLGLGQWGEYEKGRGIIK
jgi:hypothetical protein